MKKIINLIFMFMFLSAPDAPAQQMEQAGRQNNIIKDIHREHDISFNAIQKDTSEPEGSQRNLLRVIQKEHDISYEKEHEQDQKKAAPVSGVATVKDKHKRPVSLKPGAGAGEKHQRRIADSWKKYEEGKFQEAAGLFSKVVDQTRDPAMKLKAYHGLGLSLKQLGNSSEAQDVFEVLVEQNYKLQETTALLMELLVMSHDWSAAGRYLDKLPEDQKTSWSQKIQEGRFVDEYNAASEEKDAGNLGVLINNYRHFLAECRMTGTFLDAAAVMSRAGEPDHAWGIYNELLKCRQRDFSFRLQVHHEIEKNLPVKESLASVEKEIQTGGWEREYADMLSALHMRLLKKQFLAAEKMSAEYLETGENILDINPADHDVRSILAWDCFNGNDYQCSLRHFEILNRDDPGNMDYQKGLIYSLIKTGSRDRALLILDRADPGQDHEIAVLRHNLYSITGEQHYKENNYKQAEYFLLKALEIKPQDPNNRTLLAWTYFRQEKYDSAVRLFNELYMADKSTESAGNLMLAFDKLPGDEQAKLLSGLQGDLAPVLLKMAADRRYDNNAPMTASYIYNGEGTCYENCKSPVVGFSGYYRNKTGDSGLSRLTELSIPLSFHLPVRAGREWVFSVTHVYLDSGDAPSDVYAGHYFRYIHDSSSKQRHLTDSVMVYEPEIRYRSEGQIEKEFMLGTTPLNGHIDPLPRFMGKITRKDQWFIQLHQESVRESILSYTGLEDPYSDKKWGRVLKTGAGAGITFALASPYWVSLDAGYDHYWGKNVVKNYSVSGNISAGRTDSILNGEANTGLFITSRHFNRNTAFFTFGHGGYFSPDRFFIAGPFFRYKTEACSDFWFDGEVSAGYMYFRTEDAPHYHKVVDSASLLNSAAQTDLSGEYEGEKKSTLGLNLKLKAVKLINDYIGIGAYLKGSNSADFSEFSAGVVLQYYFGPVKMLAHNWDVFQWMEEK
ncbi:MAG: hypothetical protein C4581_13880 [Nitrospiraceae bacterium]|nr:MAG: hypothetical protein C4581_13880 [Nitrospiraceae bacterium]